MDAAELGRENILQTYEGLAMAVPGTKIFPTEGYVLVRGPDDVTFCNYAIGFRLAPSAVTAVIDDILDSGPPNPGFTIFSLTGDEPSDLESHLARHGFTCVSHLSQMISARTLFHPPAQVQEATTAQERTQLCEFLVQVFFEWTKRQTQSRITNSMRLSPHRFFSTSQDGKQIGGVMVVESPHCTGLYSLGVKTTHRGHGVGRSLISFVRNLADERGVPVILQCAPGLSSWYETCGFQTFGSVRAFQYRNHGSMI